MAVVEGDQRRLTVDYQNMDQEERIALASKLLIQSPPGEINDVLNGTRRGTDNNRRTQDTVARYSNYHR